MEVYGPYVFIMNRGMTSLSEEFLRRYCFTKAIAMSKTSSRLSFEYSDDRKVIFMLIAK